MAELLITAVGPDRPGLVDTLTGCLLDAGGNVADSRMINLGGRFAVILQASVPDGAIESIGAAVRAAGKGVGLDVGIEAEPVAATESTPAVAYLIRVFGMDKPGIVHQITHTLHEAGANIEELTTNLEPGSYTGTPQFTLDACATVPADVSIKALRSQLQTISDSMNCDFDMEPA